MVPRGVVEARQTADATALTNGTLPLGTFEGWKLLPNVGAVYLLRNDAVGIEYHVDRYVGSGVSAPERFEHYQNMLRGDLWRLKDGTRHHGQRAYNRDGEKAFVLGILEWVVQRDDETREQFKKRLRTREQWWMDYLEVVKYGYNMVPTAGGGWSLEACRIGGREAWEAKKTRGEPAVPFEAQLRGARAGGSGRANAAIPGRMAALGRASWAGMTSEQKSEENKRRRDVRRANLDAMSPEDQEKEARKRSEATARGHITRRANKAAREAREAEHRAKTEHDG